MSMHRSTFAPSNNASRPHGGPGAWARVAFVLRCGLGLAVPAALLGCGSGLPGVQSPLASVGTVAGMSGHVHGGQQPVVGAKVYLYAVSTTAMAGAAQSLLTTNGGYVQSDANGNFSITGDYTCPAGAYVYLLALGGNPGLNGTVNNANLALAAGLGACSSLSASSYFTLNEVTTVAFAYALASYATSETQIGSATAGDVSNAFGVISRVIDSTHGLALGAAPGNTAQTINSLANSLGSCVNSSGGAGSCASLMSDANVASSGPVDTFQAVLNVANNPTANVQAIYNLGASNGPFQPTLAVAPANWTVPLATSTPASSYTLPAFFTGETALGNGVYFLTFPSGNYFGYYSFLTDPHYLYHFDMGYEYVFDAKDGLAGVYFYDFASGHYWYTSPAYPFPYMYDYTLNSVIYYYPDPNNPGHYNINGVRYFYVFSTGQIISM